MAERTPRQKTASAADGLEVKFHLMTMLPYDNRVRRKHMLVYGFILDWFHRKYGDALASVRHIEQKFKERDPAGKGLSVPHIHSAISDLVSWGYLSQDKGAGKRASRYIPVWDKSSVTSAGNAKPDDPSVTSAGNSSVTSVGNTKSDSVTYAGNEDPLTLTRSTDPGTGKGDIDSAAPVRAPPGCGLSAAGADAAEDGFEQLYRGYGVRKGKAAARAAFEKLGPSPEKVIDIIAAARAWRAAAEAGGIERIHLKRWIEGEHYDEEPPRARRPISGKRTNTPKPPKADKRAAAASEARPPLPARRTREARIIASDVMDDGSGRRLLLTFEDVDGAKFEHGFYIEHNSSEDQQRGQAELGKLKMATGLSCVTDTSQLHDIPILISNVGAGFEYAAHPANENVRWAA